MAGGSTHATYLPCVDTKAYFGTLANPLPNLRAIGNVFSREAPVVIIIIIPPLLLQCLFLRPF